MIKILELYTMDTIYNLSGAELYNLAQTFYLNNNIDAYIIHRAMAANNNYPEAIDNFHNKIFGQQQTPITVQFFKDTTYNNNLINNGYSIYCLAWIYQEAIIVEKNYTLAFELYQKAMKKNIGLAFNNLGFMYDNGMGVEKDYKKSAELYQTAMEKKISVAFNNMAFMYWKGLGIDIDYNKAIKLFKKAINKNDTYARNNLIVLFKELSVSKIEIIQHLYEINGLEYLKNLYGYDDFTIETIQQNIELKDKNSKLEKEISDLNMHIESSPEGKLYLEAKQEWYNNI